MIIEHQPLFRNMAKVSELVCRDSGVVTTDESWHQEPMYAPYSRLYYVKDGAGVLYSESERMPLEPGYVYVAPCGMKYGYYGTDSVTKLYFHINLLLGADDCDAFADYGHFIRLERTVEQIDRLIGWFLAEDPFGHMVIKSELYRTACEALQIVRETDGSHVGYSRPIMRAIGYIHRNLSARLTVGEISEEIFCSRSRLSMLFREEMGQSVARYIDDLLMSEAQTMLLYSERSVGEISDRLGFCDQFYFSRCFTKRFSVSPTQFRKSRG
ncbi:MAG: helix-turn-helix transcriptional regulator [Clostridia bacterium]|nr:helix-turn-helix transcriptional regulator [Clostridia bacterium]